MAEQIISASGTQYGLIVNPDGSLNVGSMPAVSIGTVSTGSNSYLFGKSGADYYPLLSTSGTDGGLLRVDSSVSVSTGSEVYVKAGSIQILSSAGSIGVYGTLSASAGSETWIKGGSVSVWGEVISDTGNTFIGSLLANGSFIGSAFDMTNYATWSTSIFSDTNSASGGLKIQWSEDGTNWDFADTQTYNSGAGNMITFGRKTKYVRLNYTNTNANTGSMRIYSYGQPISVRQTRKFVGNALSDQDTGQVVIASLQGHTTAGGGGWVDVKVDPAGNISTVSTGSFAITNSLPSIGSYSVQNIAGSVYAVGSINIIQGTNPLIVLGSVNVNNQITSNTGSEVYIKAGSVQTYSPVGVGSVRVSEWGITTPITTTGSTTNYGVGSIRISEQGLDLKVAGSVYVIGSVNIATALLPIVGSVSITNSGSVIQGTTPWVTSGAISNFPSLYAVSGIINQGTSPWIILGSVNVNNQTASTGGSEVYIKAGSVQIYNPVGIGSTLIVNSRFDLGSFLLIAGSISSMPSLSVSAGSEQYIKGGSILTYSGTNYINAVQQTNPWIVLGSVAVTSPISVSTGSEVYIKAGSVQTYNPVGIGSVTIVNARYDLGSFLLIAGSISSMPPVTATAGSESWIKGGSIAVYAGSTYILSSPGSIGVVGSVLMIGSMLTYFSGTSNHVPISGIVNFGGGVGSVRIAEIGAVGSTYLVSSPGSIGVVGSFIAIGSMAIYPSAGSLLVHSQEPQIYKVYTNAKQMVGSSMLSLMNSGPNSPVTLQVKRIVANPLSILTSGIFTGRMEITRGIYPGFTAGATGSFTALDPNNAALNASVQVRCQASGIAGSILGYWSYTFNPLTNMNIGTLFNVDETFEKQPIVLRPNDALHVYQTAGNFNGSISIEADFEQK